MTQRMTRHDYLVRDELNDLADELDAVTAERDSLRAQLDTVREALTKDRVIMVTRHNGYTVEDYSNPLVPVKAIERALEGEAV